MLNAASRGMGGNGTFGVDEQRDDTAIALSGFMEEGVERGVAATARHKIPTPAESTGSFALLREKVVESSSQSGFAGWAIAAAFDVDLDAGRSGLRFHGLPPSSPILHRSPRRYLSSQCDSLSASKRESTVPPRCSQTTIDSTWADRAETNASECVVTMS